MLKKIISTSQEDEPAADESYANESAESYESYETPAASTPAHPSASSYSSESSYASAPSQMSSKNILASDVKIKGSLTFNDELILDGSIEGEVVSDGGHLTIGENASIKGEVRTRGVVVYGKVDGNLTVTERCELKADAEIVGDIKAGTLSIEEGAAFMGQSAVGSAAVASASKPKSPTSSSSSSSSTPKVS